MKEAKETSTLRFWIARAVESFLRGPTCTVDQVSYSGFNKNKILRVGGYNTGNMSDYNTGIMCGYKTNPSKKFCAGMTAIRPITRKFLELC